MKYKFLLIFFFNAFFSCQTSNFTYLPPSNNVINQYAKYYLPQDINFSKWDRLESIFPANYKNLDYTEKIQAFFLAHKNILLPDYPIYISNGLKISSNTNVFFQKNSKIFYIGEVKGRHYDIVKIEDVENVNVYNPYVIGNRDAKLEHTGEWNAGISIQDSKNVKIYNAIVKNTWGDGIFIGSETARISENIIIDGGWIDNTRRNGISVTSAKKLNIKKILITNIHGTSPETGLHIEPSLYEEVLEDISIDNVYSYNNVNGGLGVNLQAFSLKGKPAKYVTIDINNFKTNMSNYSLGFSINNTSSINNPHGKIRIRNSVFESPKKGYIWSNEKKYDNLSISYENIKNK